MEKIVVNLFLPVTLTVFDTHFSLSFSDNCSHKKVKKDLHHHHTNSLVCTLIDHSSQPIRGQEIAQLLFTVY